MHIARRQRHIGRWFLIVGAGVLCAGLLIVNALYLFTGNNHPSFLVLASFGFSAFTASIYLAVGSLVWLFARRRLVAHLLFCSSLAVMVTFANETASGSHIPLLAALTGASGVIALTSFTILLLIFPYDYLASFKSRQGSTQAREAKYGRWILRAYICGHIAFASLIVVYALAKNIFFLTPPVWVDLVINLYYLLALACILVTIIGSYCFSGDMRTRQQLLLFVAGVLLAFAPILFLTVLPQALHMPEQYTVNGQLSSLPMLLLPPALGYSILRYQILVFDRYIRRVVSWLAGIICLAVLCYVVLILSRIIFAQSELWAAHIICVTVGMALLGPLTWWLAHVATERLFFPEIRHFRQYMQRPELLTRETVDLSEAAELLLLAIMQAFETQDVCLYVLDERTGYYHLAPIREVYRSRGALSGALLQQMTHLTGIFQRGDVSVIEARHPLVRRLATARRPLFLHEVLNAEDNEPAGLARYMMTIPREKANLLLVPVRAQGKIIGILCLGERSDGQNYAGPDFEVIHLLLSHYASILETARLYVQASRHVAVLNALYSANARLERTYMRIEEVAVAYATVAAEAMQATSEIWLYQPERAILHRLVHAGKGAYFFADEWIGQLQEQEWLAWFREGSGSSTSQARGPAEQMPERLAQVSDMPFAWLPLCKGQRRMGVLILSFPHPHVFPVEEKRVLGMFARQCAAALENAQITIALREAYERQKELDRLKDQFIMTASHELRTPLTAVQGYIELLSQYSDELSPETRTEFIQKAYRGCDELALMVGNIMDASRLQIEAERIRLVPVDLISAVQHVTEILESMTTREQRPVKQMIASGLLVLADELRLRQVLLNLVSNALKYSPAGSPISIQAAQGHGLVKISVRDYGLGVPPEEQERLFERFVRLERDINSSVRGAGLGLYITRRLVEAMGGRLWVTSTGIPGEGSTFSFTLQRATMSHSTVSEVPILAQRSR